ncbi:MAG: hypothetical protein ACFFC7_11010 [Candidatus Hermodarchaeota archaeon]
MSTPKNEEFYSALGKGKKLTLFVLRGQKIEDSRKNLPAVQRPHRPRRSTIGELYV